MRRLRQPPRIKALEALAAIADGRVERLGDKAFLVRSSDGSRLYHVYVDPEKGVAYSDDNGTKLRGYIGYPIIAALILMGLLPRDDELAEAMRGIPWRRLNEELKKYALVIERVKEIVRERGVDPSRVDRYMEEVSRALRRLRLSLLPQPPLELAAATRGGGGGVGEDMQGGGEG